MNYGNKIAIFKNVKPDKDFRHNSITLFVNLDNANHCKFQLNIDGKLRSYTCSRSVIDNVFINYISDIIRNCFLNKEYRDNQLFNNHQKKLAELTDDLLPRELRKDISELSRNYKYLVISDETMSVNLPYPILFFPEPSFENGISDSGFFLSEVFTIIRTSIPRENQCKIKHVYTISTDDLAGSLKEEVEVHDFFKKKSVQSQSITSLDQLNNVLNENKGELFHFCCHGSSQNSIVFNKSGKRHEITMSDLSLNKFKKGSILILNICNGNLTSYNLQIPRSISDKLLDRNAELVLTTEWPVNDSFAYYLGTSLYKGLVNKKSIAYTLHMIKSNASEFEHKITALGYTLRGNPNIKLCIE